MTQFYTDINRMQDPTALPDAEVFHTDFADGELLDGWYVWACFPGCLPDGDPFGPYDTEAEAVNEWRDLYAD